MSLFTSDRERRLWLWVLAVMVALYSTLGPAQTVAAFLREQNLLRVSMAIVVSLAVGAIAWHWVKTRPGRAEIAVALAVAGAYLWTWLRIQTPEERSHLIEYGLLAVLIHQALKERRRHGPRIPAPAALAVAVTALLGLLDEGIQALLPNRVFDWQDIAFNLLAAFMPIAAVVALGWVRRRFGRAHSD